jgi:hypothetical protein
MEKVIKNDTGGVTIYMGEGGGQIVLTRIEVREIIMAYFKDE